MASLDARADAVPWTREQIEAWVNCEPPRACPQQARENFRLARATIVRLCPEAVDYRTLVGEIPNQDRKSWEWIAAATPDQIVAMVEAHVAALWARSLSDERSEEAP